MRRRQELLPLKPPDDDPWRDALLLGEVSDGLLCQRAGVDKRRVLIRWDQRVPRELIGVVLGLASVLLDVSVDEVGSLSSEKMASFVKEAEPKVVVGLVAGV